MSSPRRADFSFNPDSIVLDASHVIDIRLSVGPANFIHQALPMSLRNPSVTIASEKDLPRLFEIWESSVRATHSFLSESDIENLIPQVKSGLSQFYPIHCINDTPGSAFAFLGVENSKIEMLFVHDDYRGQGAGKLLLQFALTSLGATHVDVNEQNPQAIGFYEHFGFRTFGRSELDPSGNPFPILHMELRPDLPLDPGAVSAARLSNPPRR
jgi:putative acetyltransferase